MKKTLLSLLLLSGLILVSCDEDVPEAEDAPEMITKVELLFSPKSGGAPIVVTAVDNDGAGPNNLEPSGQIELQGGESYDLFVSFENTINEEDITEEVKDESDEHQIFYGFTEGIFESPTGAGNLIKDDGQVNYLDEDANGLPLGLITSWVVGNSSGFGSFRLVLKHQPDGIKSTTSGASDGETDVDVSFVLSIQ
ncbi:hypothetical protein [Marinoscillum sp.]|uniref:hypothetical protein n=1 Tax=Marinoscillum sp. TaxID=2024838 RepID=UPI003BAD19B3